MNDTKNLLSDIFIKLFADETNCFISGHDFSEQAKTVRMNKFIDGMNYSK